jgi:hypothetical protein
MDSILTYLSRGKEEEDFLQTSGSIDELIFHEAVSLPWSSLSSHKTARNPRP